MTNNYPNLFIPGAAKSGTSTLHDLLNLHPEICMSSLKEPYFLINTDFDQNISVYNDKYTELFSQKSNATYRGDSSTAYMLFPNFIERVKTHLKDEPKFIFVLRNPIDRIYSHYWYLKGLGSEDSNLKDAIKRDMNISPNMSHRLAEGKFKNYFQYGLYGKWISNFYKEFGALQIKIIVFEDLRDHPLKVANSCFEFLGLQKLEQVPEMESNKTVLLKYPKLFQIISKITNGNVTFLKPINRIIPRKFKQMVKKNSTEFLMQQIKSDSSYPKLAKEDRLWIKDLYLADINTLRDVTGDGFNQWSDFKLAE
ncbi:hypothetical protein A9Q87_13645 [Flavobacteriales bacterium 34_180_T64]|nr:hypothetical protein A9Q87_13645 [Flavobacteriales bacterium 34_180_T64]